MALPQQLPFASATVPIPSSSSGTVSIPVLPAIGDQTHISSITTIRTNDISNSEAVLMTATSRPDLVTEKAAEPHTARPASEASMKAKALRYIAASISQPLNPFFSGIIKLFSSRRVTDEALKKQGLHRWDVRRCNIAGGLVTSDHSDVTSAITNATFQDSYIGYLRRRVRLNPLARAEIATDSDALRPKIWLCCKSLRGGSCAPSSPPVKLKV